MRQQLLMALAGVSAVLGPGLSWAAESPCTATIQLNSQSIDAAGDLSAELRMPIGTRLFRARGTPVHFIVVRALPERATDASELVSRAVDPRADAPIGWWNIPEQSGPPTDVVWKGVEEYVSEIEVVARPGAYRLRYIYAVALPDAEPPTPAVLCTIYSEVFRLQNPSRWQVLTHHF